MKTEKEIIREINTIKEKLIKKAKSKGLYENFGEKECDYLFEKYPDQTSLINGFFNWCINYEG